MSLVTRMGSWIGSPLTRRHGGRIPAGVRPAVEKLESRCLLDNGGTASVLAEVGLTYGWATFGQALPMGVAYDGVQIGESPTQNDVKNYWPDGSIQYVILTTFVPMDDTWPLLAGTPYKGSFTPLFPEASVQLTLQGNSCEAEMPVDVSGYDSSWLAGPFVSEGRATVTPTCNGGQPHAFLRVLFDVRVYMDTEFRIDVTVENTLDVSTARSAEYNVAIIVEGQTQFSRSGVRHPYLTRWRHVVEWGLPYKSEVTPDFRPAMQAAALPYYLPVVSNRVNAPNGPDFDILGRGSLHPIMPDSSGRAEIAPYPDWTARYLVHRNPIQGSYVRAHGDLAGSWPVHVRNTDGSLISIDERPQIWLDIPLQRGKDKPAGNLNDVGPFLPDNAHQPSLAHVPYLVTGDRYYADEMAFWANFVLMGTFPGDGSYRGLNGEGYLWTNETRGFAWGFRNLVDTAVWLPDADPRKAYFLPKVSHNLAWLDNHSAWNTGPLGVAWHWPIGFGGDNVYDDPEYTKVWQSVSQHNLLAWAIDRANKQGFVGGEAFKLQVAQFNINLLIDPVTQDGAAPYWTPIGDRVPPGSSNIVWYTQLEQTYRGATDYAGYYGPDLRIACLIGLENGLFGAQEAYDYIHPKVAIEIIDEFLPDLGIRGGWAVSIDGRLGPGAPGAPPHWPTVTLDQAAALLAARPVEIASRGEALIAPVVVMEVDRLAARPARVDVEILAGDKLKRRERIDRVFGSLIEEVFLLDL